MFTAPPDCLDDNQILDLVRRRLEPEDAAALAAHLDGCAWCRALMAAVVAGESSTGESDEAAPQTAVAPGSAVGRYRILSVLGEGGMGVVYAAHDPELDRAVALKFIRGRNAAVAQRLVRESRAMAKLAHPNVVTVFDVSTHDGRLFIAMELVDGETLRAWLRRQPRSWREIVAVFAQAARGLAAAHDAQVVHRDFKPDNVLVDRAGRVRVSDFGLARSSWNETSSPGDDDDDRIALDVTITRSGSLLGTPAYMSPEQLQGLPADDRSDQFSFCVTLWEAIYDQRPFAGDSLAELRQDVLGGAIRPPPAGRKVPGWLHRLIARGLSIAPADRHPSIAALLRELERDRSTRRGRLAVSILAVAVAGAAGLGLVAARGEAAPCSGAARQLAGAWDEQVQAALTARFTGSGKAFATDSAAKVTAVLDAYRRDWIAMKQDSCESTRRSLQSGELATSRDVCLDERLHELRALTTLLVRADADLIARAPRAAAGLSSIANCADLEALSRARQPADPAARQRLADGWREFASARAHFHAGMDAEAKASAERVVRIAADIGYRPLEARGLLMLGQSQIQLGDLAAGEKTLREAVLAAEAGGDDDLAATAWAKLVSVVGLRTERIDEALEVDRHARAAAERTGDDRARALELAMRAAVLAETRPQEALDAALEADSIRRRIDATPIELAGTASVLFGIYLSLERYEEAYSAAARMLELNRAALGENHPDLGDSYTALGVANEALGKMEDAEVNYRRGVAVVEAAHGAQAPTTTMSVERLASFLAHAGRHQDALEQYRRLIAVATTGGDTLQVARGRMSVGEMLSELGRHEEAGASFVETVKILDDNFPDDPELRTALAYLGDTLLARGEPGDALPRFERAVALAEKAGGNPVELTFFLRGLAAAQLGKRDLARSVAACERALALPESPDYALDRAQIGMILARALWANGAKRRAISIARQAHSAFASLDAPDEARAAAAWLARPE